ncbi:hypothetical protein EJ06DRAFT_528284 [Trichodelitschia bisporula]|uniref:Uncharacterized protein n=1 Tax=Trichodelitschia bisporula TaxID=703511 RepID=A0A6G1I1U8_9PEZI|nr:hypothetical protein EJ06DRAFT_528284 [Trichodelitschia bisporula]
MIRYQHIAAEDQDARRGVNVHGRAEDGEDAGLQATMHSAPYGGDAGLPATMHNVPDGEDAGLRATGHTVPDGEHTEPPAPIPMRAGVAARLEHLAASLPRVRVRASPAASMTESGRSKRTEKGPAPSSGKKSPSLKGWWTEAGILLLGFSLLAAIMSVLATYHGKVQPKWKYRINLNTLAAVMSTILRACLVSVVEEVISQLKWYWHRQPRPLLHLSYFDKASRGPWGSFLFPIRLRSFSVAQLGCFLTIASFAIGPFTQQAIRSVPCKRDSPNFQPFLQTASKIGEGAMSPSGENSWTTDGGWSLDGGTKGALVGALANPSTNQSTLSDLFGGCGTGNCTFPSDNNVTHSTIAMCTKCIDTTSLIKWFPDLSNRTTTAPAFVGLPNGLNITAPPFSCLVSKFGGSLDWMLSVADEKFKATIPNALTWTSLATTSIGCRRGSPDPHMPGNYIWNCDRAGTLKMNTSTDFTDAFAAFNYISTTCILYPCTRHYYGQVQEGQLTETLVSEIPAPLFDSPNQAEFVQAETNEDQQYVYRPFAGLKRHCFVNGVFLWLTKLNGFAPDVAHRGASVLQGVYGPDGYKQPTTNATFTADIEGGPSVNLPMDCINPISGRFFIAVNAFLSTTLSGSCQIPSTPWEQDQVHSSKMGGPWFSKYRDFNNVMCPTGKQPDSWWLNGLYRGGNATHRTITGTIGVMVETLTARMRLMGINRDTNQTEFVYGTASQTDVCTEFDGWWMAMPAVALVLGAVFLAIAVVQSTYDDNQPLWKSSVLPFVFANSGKLHGPAGSVTEMELVAKGMEVELVKTGDGWEFVGGSHGALPGSGRATPV